MKYHTAIIQTLLATAAVLSLCGCGSPTGAAEAAATSDPWEASAEYGTMALSRGVDSSHGEDAEPDYELVFPQDSVNRIDISLTLEAWEALQGEMTAQFGEMGTGGEDGRRQLPGGGGGPGAGGGRPGDGDALILLRRQDHQVRADGVVVAHIDHLVRKDIELPGIEKLEEMKYQVSESRARLVSP